MRAGELKEGDEVDLVMTVPARVRRVVRKPGGDIWVQYDRRDELGRTFIVPYGGEDSDATEARDRRT